MAPGTPQVPVGAGTPSAPPGVLYPNAPMAAPPRRRHGPLFWIVLIIIVVVIVVVVLILAAFAFFFATGAATSVLVTSINFTSSDDACGTNGQTSTGFLTHGNGMVQDTLTISNPNPTISCAITSISASTPGFSVSGANTPITIPGGASRTLTFTIHAPKAAFDGVLTLDLE
jgi:hypothetical protein